MAWQKGESGNAGGRPVKILALQRRLEGMTAKAADALEKILDDPEAPHATKLQAAGMVFDRAIGKPKQAATLEVTHNASPHLTALVGLAASVALRGSSAPVIDAQPIDIIDVGTYEPQKLPLNADAERAEHGDE